MRSERPRGVPLLFSRLSRLFCIAAGWLAESPPLGVGWFERGVRRSRPALRSLLPFISSRAWLLVSRADFWLRSCSTSKEGQQVGSVFPSDLRGVLPPLVVAVIRLAWSFSRGSEPSPTVKCCADQAMGQILGANREFRFVSTENTHRRFTILVL